MAKATHAQRVALTLILFVAFLSLPGLAAAAEPIWPINDEIIVITRDQLSLDISHAEEGYFYARVLYGSESAYKLLVSKDEQTYKYDLNTGGDYELFPLQMGHGSYTISLWRNVGGKRYTEAGEYTLTVQLLDEDSYRLCPSQYVNYNQDSPMVVEMAEHCAGLTDAEKFAYLRQYIKASYIYDFISAYKKEVIIPAEILRVYERKMGTCLELSTLCAAMLRSQGIKASLIVGYADGQYHSWLEVTVDGSHYIYDPSAAVCHYKINNYEVDRIY